jgi:hypothetical protein
MTLPYSERVSLIAIIKDQLRRYPKMKPLDLYKLLYQVTFGGEHLLESEKDARDSLKAEWDNLDKVQKGEALLESIDPRGEVLRVNLRLYRKTGGTPEDLFDLFKTSSARFKKDEERLNAYFNICLEAAGKRELPFDRQDLEDLYIEMGRQNFPPKHHSKIYREVHKPAYRIVSKRHWDGFNKKEK